MGSLRPTLRLSCGWVPGGGQVNSKPSEYKASGQSPGGNVAVAVSAPATIPPLADASRRLRRPQPDVVADSPSGPGVGTGVPQVVAKARHNTRAQHRESSVPPRLLSLKQAADYLAVSYWTVRSWVETGKLLAVRLGPKLIRLEKDDLDRFVAERKEGA